MPLRDSLSNTWDHIQAVLFPWLAEELGPLTETHKQVITVLEMACLEAFVQTWSGLPGRPLKDRHALARAFVAKAVLGLPQTKLLIERLAVDKQLRQLCGWQRAGHVPSESPFSRAFGEFPRHLLHGTNTGAWSTPISAVLGERDVGAGYRLKPSVASSLI
jgi:hypothetical protein